MRIALLLVALAVVVPAHADSAAKSGGTPAAKGPACSSLGGACGACGPVGQCLEHFGGSPPPRVCVDGGRCVQTGCATDADCPAGQVCAGMGGVPACCATCP